MRDELNDIINVLSTQTGKEGKKHPKFYYWAKMPKQKLFNDIFNEQ